jgi:AbrB family looped-hinge helix DNA binding protein
MRSPVLLCYRQESGFLTSKNIYASFIMSTTGKIQNKGQVTIPTVVRRQAGLSKGDLVNIAFQRGKIVITPKLAIDRSKFPTADDEYTPAQRRVIDARLDKADAEIKAGRVHGPFSNAAAAIKFLNKEIHSRKTKRKAS